jgi:hypothetical protein
VWIAARKNLRDVVEHVTVADVASARLPDSINLLADDPEAWVTRAGPAARPLGLNPREPFERLTQAPAGSAPSRDAASTAPAEAAR